MGNLLTNAEIEQPDIRGRKRKVEDVESENPEPTQEDILNTPKRRKVKSTSRYIYETLFVAGENSDITISALGQTWQLHKFYLRQSGYFSGMFRGSWQESHQRVIHIDIPDDNIDKSALDIAFGSLYQDDVEIKPLQVASVLAAAIFLGLDGLIQQCEEIMLETVSPATVCSYHASAMIYGLLAVASECFSWLEKNLMTLQTPELLQNISHDLMQKLVKSPDLVVIQVEMDIYTLIKKWTFLQLHPTWQGDNKELATQTEAFFRAESEKNGGEAFLQTEIGHPFHHIFDGIRLHHIINDFNSAHTLEDDNIIPAKQLLPVYRQQWHQMLRIEQALDKGPSDCSLPEFNEVALRVGRVLQKDNQYCWRWTGFNYGLDLLVSFTNRYAFLAHTSDTSNKFSRVWELTVIHHTRIFHPKMAHLWLLSFKRNTAGQSIAGSISTQSRRNILYKLTAISMNNQGQTKYKRSTGIKTLSLAKDGDEVILSIDRTADFPLYISANFLYYTPIADNQEADGAGNQPANQQQPQLQHQQEQPLPEPEEENGEDAHNGDDS